MFGSVLDAEYYDIIELNGEYYSVPKSLTFVYISNACESVTEYAFYNCKSLKVVDLGSSVTKIGDYAFYQCLGLERVVINEGLEQIGDYAFYACEKLISSHEAQEIQKFVLPLSITTIGEYAFYNCASIENISLEENSRLRYIGERAFANLENTIFELALIRSLIIGDYARTMPCWKRLKSSQSRNGTVSLAVVKALNMRLFLLINMPENSLAILIMKKAIR